MNIKKRFKNFLCAKLGLQVDVHIARINYGGEILSGKRALITGGSSGIGLAIAEKFVSEGANVVITGRNVQNLMKAQSKMGKEKCSILEWDIRQVSVCREKLQQSVDLLNGLDIFVNNAGVYFDKPLFSISEMDYDTIMDTDLKGQYFAAQAAAEYFIQHSIPGKIINIVSNRGMMGDCRPYGVAKWGLAGLTYGLARDLISHGIVVNGIAPGVTATNINHINVSENAFSVESRDKRVCLPEELAELALLLVSGAANHIVGQVIVCDGGDSLR